MEEKLWANIYCQNEEVINGHHIWHYVIRTSVGNINFIDYKDTPESEIEREVCGGDYFKALKWFVALGGHILPGSRKE